MPRANRRRRDEADLDLARAAGGMSRRESHPDGEWFVRRVTGVAASKAYRCPGCDQEISPGVGHVAVWREGELDERRHWHTACWHARETRGPRVQRSRDAPRH